MTTETETKSRPILFSGEMVRAILDGRKTQTRRVLKPQPALVFQGRYQTHCWPDDSKAKFAWSGGLPHPCSEAVERHCPYGRIGDRLWVREAWSVGNIYDNTKPSMICRDILDRDDHPKNKAPCGIRYPATQECAGIRVRPSIHMPRWASRITLEITGVRLEPLHSISEDDARAEGVSTQLNGKGILSNVEAFRMLWTRINGASSWTANPWAWVVEFEVTQ